MYLFTVIMSFVLVVLSNVAIMKRIEDEGYVCRLQSKRGFRLSDLISIGLRFVPFVNLGLGSMTLALALFIVSHDDVWNDFIKDYRYLPGLVIKQFELNHISDKNLKDNLKLDGALGLDKVKEEVSYILDQSNLVRNDKASALDQPNFIKDDYNKARAMVAAEQMLYEIECNVSLTPEQKADIFKLLKKEYLKDFKKPEIIESKEDYVPLETDDLVAIGDNNNLVEKEIEVLDTIDESEFYQKVLKIIN